LEFFSQGWLLPNFNSNIIVLIPKTEHVDNVGQFRPIALANLKFEMVTKILVDRLASIMPSIISDEQKRIHKWKKHQRLYLHYI